MGAGSLQVMRILGPSGVLPLVLLDVEDEVLDGDGEDRPFLLLPPPGDGERECLDLADDPERLRVFSSSIASFSDAKNDFICFF